MESIYYWENLMDLVSGKVAYDSLLLKGEKILCAKLFSAQNKIRKNVLCYRKQLFSMK